MRDYIEESLEIAEGSANWNRKRGLFTQAYGWECRLSEVWALASHLREEDLAEKANDLRIKLRDLREEAKRSKDAG